VNVKEYIASGMIESYVMGLLTETERKEFEAVCVQHPEVAEARTAFEKALEDQLLADAKDAPVQLKQQVFDRIASAGSDSKTEDVEEETTPVRTMGAWKWIAVAAVVLMAVAAYWAFDTNNKNKSLQAENNNLQDQLNRANEALATSRSGGPAKSDFMMAAIKGDNQASATIYWDTLSKDVYLMVNNMPQPASDKQYQLWALLPQEGAAPIDLGMIEVKQQRLLYRMKNVQNAKAFAITLEPKGGSKAPTGQPMVSSAPVSL
jgi:anti-sigma-K factor RskA